MHKLTNKLFGIIAALVIILGTGAANLPGGKKPIVPPTPGTSDTGDQQPGENGNGTSSPNCDLGEEEIFGD